MDLNLHAYYMNGELKGEKKTGTLGYDGPSVVVCHDMFRANHNIVSRFDDFAIGEAG
jgi:hypothetical protein